MNLKFGICGWILLSFVFFFIVPFVVNFFIGMDSPKGVDVVGGPEDWLAFHASYIGGVLTAVIGFLTVWREARENGYQGRLQMQQTYIKTLELDLSRLIDSMQFYQLGAITLYLFDRDNIKYYAVKEINRLNERMEMVVQQSNAFGLAYGGKMEEWIRSFAELYARTVLLYQSRVNEMTQILAHLTKGELEDYYEKITNFNKQIQKDNEIRKDLYAAARKWLGKEREKEAVLQRKLKKMGFDFD